MYCVCTLDTYIILHEVYHFLYCAIDKFTAVYFMTCTSHLRWLHCGGFVPFIETFKQLVQFISDLSNKISSFIRTT